MTNALRMARKVRPAVLQELGARAAGNRRDTSSLTEPLKQLIA
ncbi:hypothetical protein [Methylocystis echinoides]